MFCSPVVYCAPVRPPDAARAVALLVAQLLFEEPKKRRMTSSCTVETRPTLALGYLWCQYLTMSVRPLPSAFVHSLQSEGSAPSKPQRSRHCFWMHAGRSVVRKGGPESSSTVTGIVSPNESCTIP